MLLGHATATAQDKPIRVFDLSTIQAYGEAIYAQDQRAALASDLLMASKLDTNGLTGWIDTPYEKDHRVRFLRDGPQGPEAAYDVVFAGKSKPRLAVSTDPALTADEVAQLRALKTASSAGVPGCAARPFNHVELHDAKSGQWLVWLLTPWEKASALPFGLHYRFTIDGEGSRIVQQDALAKSCLTMDPAGGPPGGVMGVVHLVSDTPVETHVFTSLETKRPLMVMTSPEKIWMIDGRSIKEAKR